VEVHIRRFDAADERAVREVVEHALDAYERLDVFFANAGITGPHATFADVSEEDFMAVLRTNALRQDHPRYSANSAAW
jgi:NAD(P)-dependent dehydrogenase (short-subunit alcohol dehydrogenase family)